MSDDDYGYDSPYEDMYDLLDDADPAPELADDLAERAVHSPIWQHTHTGELKEYFSDWDEHSDDYFDDDPSLLNPHGANGKNPKTNKSDLQSKRGRKRKLSEIRERPTLCQKDLEALQATLRGPVWKMKSPVLETDYKKGSDQPTALRLSDSIMRSAYNKSQGFGRGALKRDESWANDLSLADMGLTREVSMHEQDDSVLNENEDEEGEEEEEGEGEGEAEGEEEVLDPDPGKEHSNMKSNLTAKVITRQLRRMNHSQGSDVKISTEPQEIVDILVEEQISRKRRRLTAVTEHIKDPILPTPETSLTSETSDKTIEVDESKDLKSRRRGKGSRGTSPPAPEEHERKPVFSGRGRKRKMSPESSATAETASSRAKRKASSKV